MLKISNLNKFFGKKHILKDINLSLEKGEVVSILGASGCGKSTLLRIICELEEPSSGEIKINGKVSMMFQNYALMPHLNVRENIELALSRLNRLEKKLRVDELLEKFMIKDIEKSRIDKISGGQAQRVAFARAVAPKPQILLLDEPFSNLDNHLKNSLRLQLKQMIKDSGISAILVTHDKEDAFIISDKISLMYENTIIATDTPINLYKNPENHIIASFLGDVNYCCNFDTIKDCEFKKELKKRKFMFRPNSIKLGAKFKAKVLQSYFLGDCYKLLLDFDGFRFYAKFDCNVKFGDMIEFDFIR